MKNLLRMQTVSKAGAGSVISTPGAGKRVVIVDILASADTTISSATGGGGTIFAYAPAGTSNLRAGITCGANLAVWSSAGNVTINYFVEAIAPI